MGFQKGEISEKDERLPKKDLHFNPWLQLVLRHFGKTDPPCWGPLSLVVATYPFTLGLTLVVAFPSSISIYLRAVYIVFLPYILPSHSTLYFTFYPVFSSLFFFSVFFFSIRKTRYLGGNKEKKGYMGAKEGWNAELQIAVWGDLFVHLQKREGARERVVLKRNLLCGSNPPVGGTILMIISLRLAPVLYGVFRNGRIFCSPSRVWIMLNILWKSLPFVHCIYL